MLEYKVLNTIQLLLLGKYHLILKGIAYGKKKHQILYLELLEYIENNKLINRISMKSLSVINYLHLKYELLGYL